MLFSAPLFSLLLALVFVNYTIDPYAVIRGDLTHQKIEPNQHYLKVKHVLNHPSKYNSFWFGSSKAGVIDIRKIKDGNQWYNMCYSQGLPGEFLQNIKIFIKNDIDIKNIAIEIDVWSHLISPELHKNQWLRKPYVNKWNPFYMYLIQKPSYFIYKNHLNNITELTSEIDLEHSGVVTRDKINNQINANLDEHVKHHKFIRNDSRNSFSYDFPDRSGLSLDEIREIVNICKERNIKCMIYVNPIHINTYINQNLDLFFSFLNEIAGISSFYDFSGINEVTTNNINFFEIVHFRPHIGDLILDVLINGKQNEIENFGTLVSNENIEAVIYKKEMAVQRYKNANQIK